MLPINNVSQGAAAQAAGSTAETTMGAGLNAELESTWQSYEERLKALENQPVTTTTVGDLLSLMILIIQASRELRNQVTRSRIEVSASVQRLAGKIADIKMNDSQKKAAISLASGVATMAVNTAATMRMAMPKSVQDRHVAGMTDGRQSRVSDLTSKERNDLSIQLQEQRTAKYSAISRTGEMANTIVGSGNEIQHAVGVHEQEIGESNKELLAQQTPQLEEYINSLGKELAMLNAILEAITLASAANNR